jgi:hypothetical protein
MSTPGRTMAGLVAMVAVLLPWGAWQGPSSAAASAASCTVDEPRMLAPVSVRVTFTGVQRDGTLASGYRFGVAALSDLLIVIQWPGLGPRTQRLELFTPDGALYQRITAPVPASGRVETRLPVSGTWITQQSLYGTWCVGLYADDVLHAVGRTQFTLQPGF